MRLNEKLEREAVMLQHVNLNERDMQKSRVTVN
jgi:hypothetical protein